MSVYLSQREALRRACQAGELVWRLSGPPDLVVGIRRAGLPVAMAFAHGARAVRTRFVTREVDSNAGTVSTLVRWGRRLVPRRLRQLGKSILYRPVMRTAMLMQRSRPGPAALIGEIDELKVLLGTGTAQTVVVVDDAIDTGGTVQRIVGVVQAMDPRHSILTFALTSTLGLKVHDRQLHLFEDVVEFIEGDLGVLDEQATAEILAGLEPMLQSLSATAAVRLDVDARDLLTRAPHECIARALISALETIGKRAAALRLHSRCALWRLSRPASAAVARILSREFAGLPVPARKSFGALLAAELRAAVHPILRELIVHPRLILRARIETAYILAVPLAGALGHVEIIEMQSQGSLLYPHPHETGLRSVLDSAGRRPQAEN